MRGFLYAAALSSLVGACALPGAGAAPIAPVERAWAVPTLELYQEWWARTEGCSGRKGAMAEVSFYAVDSPSGAIALGGEKGHGWWVRRGNRIYLPANSLSEEWLVRHEMLHALLQTGAHPSEQFVTRCHLASSRVWRDSTLTADPANPQGR